MRVVLFLVDLSYIIVDTHNEDSPVSSRFVFYYCRYTHLFLVDLSSIFVDTHSEDSPVSSRFVFYYCRYTQ